MIPFVDFNQEYMEIKEEVDCAIKGVLEKGRFILGEEVERFEAEFAEYVGTRYAIGVNSGSDALLLAVKALGIGKGDEVITASHTVVSTADAVVRNGAKPIFVDIDPNTYCMDVARIEEKITRRTRAILPVHLYGCPADMGRISEIAEDYDLAVIEDACQAHGAEHKGMRTGSMGDLGCFSFYPTKNLGAYGDGGMVVTSSKELCENVKASRNYGQIERYHHDFVGTNSRLDELQAAILRVKLAHLDDWNRRRRSIAGKYSKCLRQAGVAKAGVVTPTEQDHSLHVYHLFVIAHEKRDWIRQYLLAKGVQTLIHYPIPVHMQKAYLEMGYKTQLPETQRLSREILSLPLHPWLKDEEILQVTKFISEALDRAAVEHETRCL